MNLLTFRSLLRAARRWMVLIIAGPVLGVAAGMAFTSTQPTLYQSTTALLVRPAQPLAAADPSVAGLTSDQVVSTYAILLVQRPMLEAVIRELGLQVTPERLRNQIQARPEVGTTILDVSVTDGNAETARDVANRLVSDFVTSVKRMQQQEALTPNARSADNLIVIAPAVASSNPVSPRPVRNAITGLVGGIVIAAALVALLEVLDQTIKDPDGLLSATGLLTAGQIPFARAVSGRRGELLVFSGDPVAEAYKALRTNILFMAVDRKLQVILVTSSLPGEGKSRTAANLAVALGQQGHRTVVIDADFRRPAQHRLFGIVRNVGLANLILQDGEMAAGPPEAVANVTVIPAGPTPPNPSELLGSGRMQAIIAELRADFAYVIIDSPPVLPVTDASILATLADGCLLVVESRKTAAPAIRRAVASLANVNARLLGAVLNKVKGPEDGYYQADYGPIPAPKERSRARRRPLSSGQPAE